jgi:4-amino-4-deoxy-L-arabinose transferase-like glycosyltransferase
MIEINQVYLSFSDGAKFADIARSLVHGLGFTTTFNFWSGNIASWISPVMPFSIAAFFKIFGVTDFAVIATSFFYFILTLAFVFLLAKKVFGSKLVAVLSMLAVGFNYDLIKYATSGASESPFIFEIIAGAYFISSRKKWGTALGVLFLVLMYFTRPQAIIYILGLVIYFLFLNFSWKKATLFSLGSLIFGALVYFFFSRQGASAISQNLPSVAISDSLRGGMQTASLAVLTKKVFYNLYNFYKLLPQIISPYLFTLFIIGIFKWGRDKTLNSFKVTSIFMILTTFLVTAITIPFFRYIHPIVPLVYIVAVATIVEILKLQITNYKQITIGKLQITKQALLVLGSCILVFLFGAGQTTGILLLDSRFERNTHNIGKPPVYVVLSHVLKENTNPNQVVVTNLDTWGSWYGERKTVWFPLEPKQLMDPATGKIPFDAIYLTSYLIDDENYYMGTSWRMIFNNPLDEKKWICEGCSEIAKEFVLKGVYRVSAGEDYERQDATGILLIKK